MVGSSICKQPYYTTETLCNSKPQFLGKIPLTRGNGTIGEFTEESIGVGHARLSLPEHVPVGIMWLAIHRREGR